MPRKLYIQVALVVKDPPTNAVDARDTGLIPGLQRSPGGGNGNLLQYSCLENPKDRGAWRATVHGVAKSLTQQSERTHKHTQTSQEYDEQSRKNRWQAFMVLNSTSWSSP